MELLWCDDLNVPLLDREVGARKCGSISIARITRPGDVRPAFPADIEITRKAVINEFNDEDLAKNLIPNNEVVLLNKIPGYADQADEVIVRGRIVGHRFYDIKKRMWRFRPLYEGVSEILALKRGYWAIINLNNLPERYDVHRDLVLEGSLPNTKYVHVAVATRDGRYHGVAKVMRNDRLRVIKSWRAKDRLPSPKPSSLEDFIELNRDYLERKARRAVDFLTKVFNEYRKPVVVSYSGGKDSLVALDLTAQTGVKFYIVFNDTGLEPYETYENVKEVSRRYGAELIVASAGDSYWRAIREFGPPARDFRWCCKVIKLGPITNTLLNRFPLGYISVVGQRAYESFQRARIPRVSVSRWVTKDIVVAPIQDWTALEVWGYVLMKGLPYNKAYEYGFDRLGCVICPANELAELDAVSERYPSIYKRLEEIIREFSESQKLPREFVDYGLWRWRRELPGDIARYVKVKFRVQYPVDIKDDNETTTVSVDRSISRGTFLEFLKMLGKVEQGDGAFVVKGKLGDAEVRLGSNNEVIIASNNKSLRVEIAGLVARSAICGECNLCINWCPTKALKRVGPGPAFIVDESRCIGCMLCSRACPSAQYLVFRRFDSIS
ncbi:phosphoadenosine phosphosulfate reductase [Vulcanisaeta sp. EB80]|jgi:phosphoadenosine phosphosulfate reductase|uniref:phosphoadenosine phosphosulfate reductase domain-containing protein n=1 Tax=Vulcanisaeta sp. EB80 TaxID=1650660 RepID=UPI0009C0B666|nr:phosphoadenosine phosphosulfate reductase family protein [Vulcanisaeta sp. EB80]MCG2864772.1 phosphoadenosine phosphosulfate reductase family protein [Vulcanisaeta sp.]MCG2866313.1 phosphoadenosine phosphosulfate reductase family protein [Vulcanisaeta sp.]MCG2885518.1 phosphoadenosine phosphosulfate reductase family protein [Vulcanisaeta sp.]PLC69045.1 phosphoadenosine phosphosulfate reductase [Vulcanisaeta sp. EB80]